MDWLVFALIAAQVYTVVYFLDKFAVTSLVKDYRGMPIYGAITGFIVGTVFWLLAGTPVLPLKDALLILLSGAFTIWSGVLYFGAMSKSDASIIIILCRLSSVFILILGYIFLQQTLSILELIGFFIILTGVIGISLQKNKSQNSPSVTREVIIKVVIVTLMWAFAALFVNLALNATKFEQILGYESWGLGIGGLTLFMFSPGVRKAFLKGVQKSGVKTFAVIFLNELMFVLAKTTTFYAYTLGPAALVSVVESTQVFTGILIGIILTIIFPRHFNENISRRNVAIKVLWGIVIFAGIILTNI